MADQTHRLAVNGVLGAEQPTTVVEFDAVSCSVMENCGTVKITVVRTGDVRRPASVRYRGFVVDWRDFGLQFVKGKIRPCFCYVP